MTVTSKRSLTTQETYYREISGLPSVEAAVPLRHPTEYYREATLCWLCGSLPSPPPLFGPLLGPGASVLRDCLLVGRLTTRTTLLLSSAAGVYVG